MTDEEVIATNPTLINPTKRGQNQTPAKNDGENGGEDPAGPVEGRPMTRS